MILLPQYQGRYVGVLGLGKSGMSTYAALKQAGAELVAWDDKGAHDTIALTHYDAWDWQRLDCVIVSPGIALYHPEPHSIVQHSRLHNTRITCDISLLMEACPDATYIGITGTNGKSTTTALTTHMLREAGCDVQYGGNIGVPALAMQVGAVYVLELSSYQLEIMDTGVLDIACLLNITPDHLEHHGSMTSYIAAKQRIFRGQHDGNTALMAMDDGYTRDIAATMPHAITVSQHCHEQCDVYMQDQHLVDVTGDALLRYDLSVIASLQGGHNHQNACVAYAICRMMGHTPDVIYEAMLSFAGLPHRMEAVAVIDGVTFINDSKATNADAAAKSLATYHCIYWIVGGVAKAGGISTLAHLFPRIEHAYCIGEDMQPFTEVLRQENVAYHECHTLHAALHAAFTDARGQQNAVILLAPAAASFDQFASFEARGDEFRDIVGKLMEH